MSKADGLYKLSKIDKIKVPAFFLYSAQDLNTSIDRELDALKGDSFAVRSSFAGEDGEKHSFAGQFETYLRVPRDKVLEKVQAVQDSLNKASVQVYRQSSGLESKVDSKNITVIVQEMVDAQCAGVCFSRDPMEKPALKKSRKLVSVVPGTAEDLVAGLVDGSTFHLPARAGETVPSYLPFRQLRQLENAVDIIEKNFGYAVDVEWAFDKGGQLYILQARAITTGGEDTAVTILDASNIQESYPGLTTPLTYSFARRAYCQVYQSMMRLFGVSEKTIEQNKNIFSNMIAYHEGKIYYNLGNWYTLVSLLPFYKTNRRFMEGMMGVKKTFQDKSSAENLGDKNKTTKVQESLGSLFSLGKIIFTALTIKWQLESFYRNLEETLQEAGQREQIKNMSLLELAALYRNLENRLLNRWDAPVVNDFFAMVAYGILNKQKEIGAVHAYLKPAHVYLKPEKEAIISGLPPQLIGQIAELIKEDEKLLVSMENKDISTALSLLAANFPAMKLYKEYLEKFGDRGLGELKLESATIEDDPSVLFATIAACARSLNNTALETVGRAKGHEPLSWPVKLLASVTGRLIARRENLRFERTRVFGLVRLIFNSMGSRLQEAGVLENRRDIFYLTVEEIFDYITGSAATTNLKALVALRRLESEEHPEISPLRLSYRGAYGTAQIVDDSHVDEKNVLLSDSGNILKGTAASAGLVRGQVRIITDPQSQSLQAGEILVAARTDPGWIVHFAVASGLITNYGSLLSHTAIVARELGLPCVVALPDATKKLRTGDLVEIDGDRGTVTIVKQAKDNQQAVEDLLIAA